MRIKPGFALFFGNQLFSLYSNRVGGVSIDPRINVYNINATDRILMTQQKDKVIIIEDDSNSLT